MLPPGHPAALTKEAALELVEELATMEERLRRVRDVLGDLLREIE
jgi:hypothetical protein